MPIMALSTVIAVSLVIPAVRGRIMTICATPFELYMARGATVSCDGIIYNATQFDRARTVVQIVLIVAVAILTREALLLNM